MEAFVRIHVEYVSTLRRRNSIDMTDPVAYQLIFQFPYYALEFTWVAASPDR